MKLPIADSSALAINPVAAVVFIIIIIIIVIVVVVVVDVLVVVTCRQGSFTLLRPPQEELEAQLEQGADASDPLSLAASPLAAS